MHLACALGYPEVVEILLKGGAHVDVVNQWMESPLHVVLQVLISKKDRTCDDFDQVKKILKLLIKNVGESSFDCHELISWKDTKGIYILKNHFCQLFGL